MSEPGRKNKPIRDAARCSPGATCESWCVPGASWDPRESARVCFRVRCVSLVAPFSAKKRGVKK